MILAIIGSRTFTDYARLCRVLANVRTPITEIVSGGAPGADRLGANYARRQGIWLRELFALWDLYGKKAGHLRNSDIIDTAEAVLAFWDGISPGTEDSIKKARARGIPVHVINF
jgi:hypothetical protein